MYCLLENNKDKGAAEKATQKAAALVKEEQKAIDKGKNKGANVEWSANESIQFSHKLTDGSEQALNELVDKIYSKYDLDGNGKLTLEQAMPFIK